MPRKLAAPPASPSSLTRTVGPLLPLAVALVGSFVVGPSKAPPPSIPPSATQAASAAQAVAAPPGNSPVPLLKAGQAVEFEIIPADRGFHAINIRRIGEIDEAGDTPFQPAASATLQQPR